MSTFVGGGASSTAASLASSAAAASMSSFTAINRTLLASWGKDAKGRVLLTGWAAVFAGVTLRAYYVRRLAKKQLALDTVLLLYHCAFGSL